MMHIKRCIHTEKDEPTPKHTTIKYKPLRQSHGASSHWRHRIKLQESHERHKHRGTMENSVRKGVQGVSTGGYQHANERHQCDIHNDTQRHQSLQRKVHIHMRLLGPSTAERRPVSHLDHRRWKPHQICRGTVGANRRHHNVQTTMEQRRKHRQSQINVH